MYLFHTLLFFFLSVKATFAANILYAATVPSPSHHVWNKVLAFGLVNKGHNVTYVSPDSERYLKPENFTHILLEGVYEKLNKQKIVNMTNLSTIGAMFAVYDWSYFQCKAALDSLGIKELLSYPADFFDLIVIDITGGSCFYPLLQKFGYPPSVAVSPFLLPQYAANAFGSPLFPSITPWYGLPYSTSMSFVERLWNIFYSHLDLHLRQKYQYGRQATLARNVFGKNIPPMKDLEKHLSILLANTHPLLDYPQPLPPNIIPVGGLHTRKTSPMSLDLKEFLDKAENGVVVFSLGANIRSDAQGLEVQKELLKAFSQLRQTVLWKFDGEVQNPPQNVIVRKWLPQSDVLGHRNVKLFIGHGGTLSTQEAIYHGVPMILVPFAVDQRVNAKLIVERKLGLSMDSDKITSIYVLKKIREILKSSVYRKNVKKASKAFKDSPQTSLERATFWIEYVLRNGNAHFLGLPSRNMSLFSSTGLDVLLFVLAVLSSTLLLVYAITAAALRQILCKAKKTAPKVKKN